MDTTPKTVAELAATSPQAIMVLEKLGIDYCCNGKQTVESACRRSGVTTGELLTMIAEAPAVPSDQRSWAGEPMAEIISFITTTHHRYTREALAMVSSLAERVREVHGANHVELFRIEQLVRSLAIDLLPHMLKEEQVLFPYINSMEESAARGVEPPMPFFGTARNPIRMMMIEHETAGEMLLEIRTLTADFTLPPEACTKYRALFARLEELELDLHRHIHLENNILFPRAMEVEDRVRTSPVLVPAGQCCVA